MINFPEGLLTWFFGARYYDVVLSGSVRQEPGAQPASPRRAVYLIFPSEGVLASHERSLRYLTEKGVATTVVSNVPLSSDDKKRILNLCHHYIERPNFGYDFGGYREGVLSLGADIPALEQLILLNDSTWFPIQDTTDWLEDVEALGVDFAAAASNYGLPRPEPEAFADIEFDYRVDHPNFHYCSFALSFSNKMLGHPGFLNFWKRFPLSNSKKRTVRRGEIGLTQWALKNGFSHGATFDVGRMKQKLTQLDDIRLRRIASMLIIMDDRRMREVQQRVDVILPDLPRDDVISFILTAAARKGVSYATAEFNIFDCGFPFLKKSPLWLDPDTSRKTLEILRRLTTPASEEALNEAQTTVRRRLASTTVRDPG
ncbi:rhamnan synthesis F family protein [uncultured Roseobacter sp.]|uniref:rhamnan synthesis F family protein n=1 Tax=uncultured Roseobacter sp. TaxID=114847 RepID=UPI00261FDB22|nr:rhamnan synthesis F family protein [uncultured Roseobacter sp.]